MARRRRKSVGGGGARNPNSLANLRSAPAAPSGNARALKHSGYANLARDTLDDEVAQIFAAIAEDTPVRGVAGELPAGDAVGVRLLAECLHRLDGINGYLRDYGQTDPKSKKLRVKVIALGSQLRREARDHAESLGLGPRAMVKLGLDVQRATDLASAMSNPDPVERTRLLDEAGLGEEVDDD